ncbi:mechanosensitive ion channel family protein [Salsuginibacillus kocurii]|uniref:mechanosensitive ion channel family protein n=1 Tax=Salsuginibacillus kocurii TaxID=427078 RepID=UPI00036AF612|nr:mechanosensitive ion channel family protein [Salsuginibacillus kocurii]
MPQWIEEGIWGAFLSGAVIIALQILLAVIAYFIARAIGKKIINRSFTRMQSQKNMHPGRVKTLEKLGTSVFSYVLIFIFVTIIVGIFELDIAPLIASAGVIGLAIGFGAQGLVSDVVTGFFILMEKQIEVDDYITISGLDGVVEEVGLRTTQIRGFDGTLHFIPNREIGSVSNHSRGNMQALVDISISYNDNADEAIRVLQAACNQVASEEEAIKEGPHVIGVQSLGDSDVVIRILAQTANMEQWGVERMLRKAGMEALQTAGIEIPYPHQVYVHKDEAK